VNILYWESEEDSELDVSQGMRKGCFIVFEGIDGSGKSEQYERLVKRLDKDNYRLISTREPTKGTEIGTLIHSVLYENKIVSEETLALLFAADRVEHTFNKIVPALQENTIVISDRYVYSSLAYQTKGMKKELEFDWVFDLNKYAIKPDVVVYLDITAETGQNRLFNGQVRLEDHTYFETIIQQEKIRSVYYSIFNFDKKTLFDFGDLPKKIIRDFSASKMGRTTVLRINGDLSINKIENIISKQVQKIL
jgi:dTMP kinase